MLRSFSVAFATILILTTTAVAQKGQQILDLFLQGAQQEIYRQQQLENERRQRQEFDRLRQQFVGEWYACHGGDVGACERALTFTQVNTADRQVLLRKRAEIIAGEQRQRERAAAEAQERLRRDAVEQRRRSEDEARARVEQQVKSIFEEREREKLAANAGTGFIAFGVPAALLAIMGMLAFALRRRLQAAWTSVVAATVPPVSSSTPASTQPTQQFLVVVPAAATTQRDTPAAIAAMELALAYIQEVQDADRPSLEDKAERKHQLNTLALAAKQLDLAERLEADAILEVESEDVPIRFTINELKAEALLLEGMTHQLHDVRRAIPALVRATELNPSSAHAFYVLGLTHAANMSKAKAVTAFGQAVALDPKNIAYRKELNRVQNVSGAEIAAYRVTRSAETVFDNSVRAWNIFAVIWNVLTFPLRVIVRIFRALRLHPFA